MALYNTRTGKPVASGIRQGTWVKNALKRNESYLKLLEDDILLHGAADKIVIIDNYGRETVSDCLWAEDCAMSREEFEEFDRCVNSNDSPDYFTIYPKDKPLYVWEP